MQFLNPIWLFATGAILVPIIIHLWNLNEGKTLKIGSIILLGEQQNRNANRLKISDLLLLILRCLLIIIISFLLAEPVFTKFAPTDKQKNWFLIPKGLLAPVYAKYKFKIDSLINKGYEFHYFENDFPKEDFIKILADTIKEKIPLSGDYRQKLEQLNLVIQPSQKIALFTDDLSTNFYGKNPIINFKLNWFTINIKSYRKWLVKAAFTNDDEILLTEGFSNTNKVSYTQREINPSSKNNSGYTINIDNGITKLGYTNSKQFIIVDSKTLNVYIYSGKNKADESYVLAALKAIKKFKNLKISIKNYNKNTTFKSKDWLFWLSEESVYQNLKSKPIHILAYDNGKLVNQKTILKDQVNNLSTILNKYFITEREHQQNIWENGRGNPVLSYDKINNSADVYTFYSRFNPQFTSLVWDADFPEWLFSLLYKQDFNYAAKFNLTKIESGEITPIFKNIRSNNQTNYAEINISNWFWILALFLFATERFLSFKKT